MIAIGIYIKSKLSLCHSPSYEMIVFANSFLSDNTNNTKKAIAIIKQTILIPPIADSLFLNERIAKIKGTKSISINPITEPIPCIFDAVVIMSFDSFTQNKDVKIQAPIAKTEINAINVTVNRTDTK